MISEKLRLFWKYFGTFDYADILPPNKAEINLIMTLFLFLVYSIPFSLCIHYIYTIAGFCNLH